MSLPHVCECRICGGVMSAPPDWINNKVSAPPDSWINNKLVDALQRDLPLMGVFGSQLPAVTPGLVPMPPVKLPKDSITFEGAVPTGTISDSSVCTHGYTVCKPCKFPPAPVALPDLGMRGAWAEDKPEYPLNGFGPSGPEPV